MAVDVRFDAVPSGYPFMSFSFWILVRFALLFKYQIPVAKKSKLKQIIILNRKAFCQWGYARCKL
jgi:hypothetical protein